MGAMAMAHLVAMVDRERTCSESREPEMGCVVWAGYTGGYTLTDIRPDIRPDIGYSSASMSRCMGLSHTHSRYPT